MQRIQQEESKGLSEAAIATLQTSLGIEVKTMRNNSNCISDTQRTTLQFNIHIR